jgi:hypothetical protein
MGLKSGVKYQYVATDWKRGLGDLTGKKSSRKAAS